ncbi:MAG: DUF5077 domain-containing protein, partial [Flavitalea sp.]
GAEEINENGLANWSSQTAVASTYFRVSKKGLLSIGLRAKVVGGTSTVKLTVNGKSFDVKLSGGLMTSYPAGNITLADTGYIKVDLQGVSKTGNYFGDVAEILIGGAATAGDVVFANDPENYYWSRRGPSCHLNYTIPTEDKEYFYSELTVPVGEDVPGSYFMANGFGEGYFGIQVKSTTERWILFSVWDPAEGNGMTQLVRKGDDITAQRFGGEGTGGQSFMVFNWRAGTTYKFLTKGTPDGAGNTVYTSWFFAPELNTWKLMATWSRPKTEKYLTNLHGFLENFYPDQGYLGRKALWGNQWVKLKTGEWKEVTEFRFSVDATGKNRQRLDFAGGQEDGKFYLQNGGYFSKPTAPSTVFSHPATGKSPSIEFNTLP